MPGTRAKRKEVKCEPIKPSPCVLCKLECDDEMRFGKLLQQEGITVHHFCVLFACGLAQNASSTEEGIEGFLVEDIQSEVRRAQRLRCSFCKRSGATIGCYVKRCQKMFHLHCGQENGVLNQFFNEFRSFCKAHKPRQATLKGKMPPNLQCGICYGDIERVNSEIHLRTPCCTSGWFHRTCVQRYAVSAGYFFKCPLCNNKDLFRDEMLDHGIYIPDQDAAWENEQNAYHELLERPECGASECLCPEGRRMQKSGMWRMVYCEDCGSTARHIRCENLSRHTSRWRCSECVMLMKKLIVQNKTTNSPTIIDLNVSSNDNLPPTSGSAPYLSELHVEPTEEMDFIDVEADTELVSLNEVSENCKETSNAIVMDSAEAVSSETHIELECEKELQNSTFLEGEESIEIMRDDRSNIEKALKNKDCNETDVANVAGCHLHNKPELEDGMQVERSVMPLSDNKSDPLPDESVKEFMKVDKTVANQATVALDCDKDSFNGEISTVDTITNSTCSSEFQYSEDVELLMEMSCSTPVPTIIKLKDELVKETVEDQDVHSCDIEKNEVVKTVEEDTCVRDTEENEVDVVSYESLCDKKKINAEQSSGPLSSQTRSYLKLGNLPQSSGLRKKNLLGQFNSKGYCQTPITRYLIHSSFTSEDITLSIISSRPKAKPLRKRRNDSIERSRGRPRKKEEKHCSKLRKIDTVLRLRN